MIQNLAVKYKKRSVAKNVYIFIYDGILKNVNWDCKTDSITYMDNYKEKRLFNMEDLDFVLSDDKSCYSDYIEINSLKDIYNVDTEEEILNLFYKDAISFVRYGVIDGQGNIKIISSMLNEIENAKPDSKCLSYMISYDEMNGPLVEISEESFKSIKKNFEEGNLDIVRENLNEIEHFMDPSSLGNEELERLICNNVCDELEQEQIDLKQTMKNLDKLIGIVNVKKNVKIYKNFLDYLNKVEDFTNIKKPNLNMVFMGNPGTGKTTVARIVSQILYGLGYVEKNNFKEITTQDLIAEYVGQTAVKTREFLDENESSVILIDEAYTFNNEAQLYAEEALAEILKEMEKQESIFIFAGYQKEMKDFIDMNPGLKSRIGYYINFEDYSIEELMQMLLLKIKTSKLKINPKAKLLVQEIIKEKMKSKNFGNGRFIDKLYDKILMSHANNVVDSDDLNVLKTITYEDIESMNLEEMEPKSKEKKLGF